MRRRAMAMLTGAVLLMATAIPARAQVPIEYFIGYYAYQAGQMTTQAACKALDKDFKAGVVPTGGELTLTNEDKAALKAYSIEWLKPAGPCRLVGPDGPIEPTA